MEIPTCQDYCLRCRREFLHGEICLAVSEGPERTLIICVDCVTSADLICGHTLYFRDN